MTNKIFNLYPLLVDEVAILHTHLCDNTTQAMYDVKGPCDVQKSLTSDGCVLQSVASSSEKSSVSLASTATARSMKDTNKFKWM